ncbi:3-deoxy-D-manno-octulosonic acid transferase [Helicobacter sp. 13S00482-2]|uniref:lipid IV(A) 3-deoxy-D-manno-octulosonic acid transferase n=1 Tax=Helicobacter sp. 13S00482-2 TaxID=1476200 RepID=UPI000BA6213A|nr:lipid IV(A) 3-deoxy-D-manno-octulosonic acid transferase [Helicobacter sp. 13S00482-2]PAF54154.1 3-deoxy-D-manno-octulosonic acid transferase [Helicobacter sp. 13S00482-2]
MFGLIYYLVSLLVYIISTPFLILTSLREKYKYSIPQRFFLRDFSLSFSPYFWFHACSYGEIKSLESIIEAMPKKPILITTITQTGFDLAKKTYAKQNHIQVKFLPFEVFIPFWKHKLKSLQTLVITEAELWYMVFKITKNIGAKTMLINSRISERSFPKYKRFGWFYKKIFEQIDEILAQNHEDVKKIKDLGGKQVEIFGNLKLFNTPKITSNYPKSLKTTFIASSTHPKEEELILKAFLKLRDDNNNCWLILVPRHPERFQEVQEIVQKILISTSYQFKIFSKEGINENCDVLLIDALGELNNLYKISDVTILGGSFVKIGGHNPLEPAFFHNKLISGPYIFNQNSLFEAIDGYKIITQEELVQTMVHYEDLPNAFIKDKNSKLNHLITSITQTTQG